MYDYYEAVKEDVLKYIEEEVDTDGIDFKELETQLMMTSLQRTALQVTQAALTHPVERKRENT